MQLMRSIVLKMIKKTSHFHLSFAIADIAAIEDLFFNRFFCFCGVVRLNHTLFGVYTSVGSFL
jgi:hypothetical protein